MNRKERRSLAKSGKGPALPPDQAQKMLQQAVRHHQAGRPREAGPLYDKVLAAYPDQPDALHFSGILLSQLGRATEGVKRLARAVELAPKHPEILANYGQALASLGRNDEAETTLRRALNLQPLLHDAHNNLANLLKAKGECTDAEAAYRAAISAKPDFAGAWNNLGNLLEELGQTEDALEALQKSIELAPEFAGAHCNLGALQLRLGQPEAAESSLRRALELSPSLPEAHENLGVLCMQRRQYEESVDHLRTALRNGSASASVRLNLANALRGMGHLSEAEKEAETVRKAEPENVEALRTLGGIMDRQARFSAAHSFYEQARVQDPDDDAILNALGVNLLNQGKIEDAVETLTTALKRDPENSRLVSNLLLTTNYGTDSAADIFARHSALAHRGRERGSFNFVNHDRSIARDLRIGFVSADLRRHSVAFFLAPLLAQIDQAKHHIVCYANVRRPDDVSTRLQGLCDQWTDVHGMSDHDMTDCIRKDAIDILIDLSGHTRGNRLGVFAKRAAPVQITWLGYPNTTGIDGMDYRITDVLADPPGLSEPIHTETLIRLPGSFLCYAPLEAPPKTVALPAIESGHITFASFNNWSKVTAHTIRAWSDVLRGVPTARLYLKARALADPDVRAHCLETFATHDIATERLDIAGWHANPAEHLSDYRQCDIALDTWPYNGTTTSCEALWMGVPVVTMQGDRHASRVGASLLHQVGLDDLIASNDADYVGAAVNLANDLRRLQDLRKELRQRASASPLGDSSSFARRFEATLQDVWQKWCNGSANETST